MASLPIAENGPERAVQWLNENTPSKAKLVHPDDIEDNTSRKSVISALLKAIAEVNEIEG